jgi:hypothetical protein
LIIQGKKKGLAKLFKINNYAGIENEKVKKIIEESSI